ncbi:hypothetical protein PENSPDRAFT_690277 [Peniophora sp. CONT]|nr:hypothetical protein PENSPDRAFT_690277 [Peniophora sp. CONT]
MSHRALSCSSRDGSTHDASAAGLHPQLPRYVAPGAEEEDEEDGPTIGSGGSTPRSPRSFHSSSTPSTPKGLHDELGLSDAEDAPTFGVPGTPRAKEGLEGDALDSPVDSWDAPPPGSVRAPPLKQTAREASPVNRGAQGLGAGKGKEQEHVVDGLACWCGGWGQAGLVDGTTGEDWNNLGADIALVLRARAQQEKEEGERREAEKRAAVDNHAEGSATNKRERPKSTKQKLLEQEAEEAGEKKSKHVKEPAAKGKGHARARGGKSKAGGDDVQGQGRAASAG